MEVESMESALAQKRGLELNFDFGFANDEIHCNAECPRHVRFRQGDAADEKCDEVFFIFF